MFPERRPFHEELNAFNRIAVKDMCVIIRAMVVWIGRMIVTHFAGFPRDNTHRVGNFISVSKSRVARSDVADGCNRRYPEQLVDTSSAEVVLEASVHKSIVLPASKRGP
jgi:hypothetical protein